MSQSRLIFGSVFHDLNPGRNSPHDGSLIVDTYIRGYVGTIRKSFTLGQSVVMALIEGPLGSIGARLEIFEDEDNGKV